MAAAQRRVEFITRVLTAGAPSPSVVAFGSVCADNFWYFKDLPLGQDPNEKEQYFKLHVGAKIPCQSSEEAIGGSAANVATGLVRLGVPTTLLCAIGDDTAGKCGVSTMKERGVNTEGMVEIPGTRTDQSTVIRSSNIADRTILTYKGAPLTPETVKAELVANATLFVWTSVNAQGPVDAIKKCIKVAKRHGVKVAAAPSQAMIVNRPKDMLELLADTNVMSLNDTEVKILTKSKTLQAAIANLMEDFPALEMLQVTRGKDPAILVWRQADGKLRVVKSVPPMLPGAKIVDTTGAGDACATGLLYSYLKKTSAETAAKISGTVATAKLLKKGAATGLPYGPELERLLTLHKFQLSSFTTTIDGLRSVSDNDIESA